MTTAVEYHRLTVHSPSGAKPDDPRLVEFQSMDLARRPPQCKTYEGLDRFELPQDTTSDRLSRTLFFSAGVVRVARYGDQAMLFRAAGSAGNLQPVEVYVLHDGGLYHYDPPGHALTRLRMIPGDTPPALILTGVPWRTGWKYRERGFRHLYWDAGSMLAQILALEPDARVEMGFVDVDVTALVGADGVDEFPLAVVGLDGEVRLPDPAEVPTGLLADRPLEFPLVTAMQRAGDLSSADEVAAWQSPRPGTPAPAPDDLENLILRRGSTRAFDPNRAGPSELWTDAMEWATGPVRCDWPPMLEHFAVVNGIDGVPSGAWQWGDDAPLREGRMRREAAYLCLGQPLGGTGAYTVFHSADVDALDDRSYRAALLEAGVVSGRLHLAAFARGFGATGLTYFDEEVRQFFDTRAWPLLVTAVGAPAYRSRPGGDPRNPTVLQN